jgi:isopenicillin N synthase-like dioxygenase
VTDGHGAAGAVQITRNYPPYASQMPLTIPSSPELTAKVKQDGFLIVPLENEEATVLAATFDAARRFFRAPLAQKVPNKLPEDLGYRPSGIEYSQSSNRPDPIESFSASARTSASRSQLMSASALLLHDQMIAAIKVLEPLAEILTVRLANVLSGRPNEERLAGSFHRWSCLQLNYARPSEVTNQFIHELHEDGHLVTIACATGPGLEVQQMDGEMRQVTTTTDELIVMPGEIAFLLSGGQIQPLYHRVRPEMRLRERLALLFFGDIDPGLCAPWVRNAINENIDIGGHVLSNANRFGLRGFSPD